MKRSRIGIAVASLLMAGAAVIGVGFGVVVVNSASSHGASPQSHKITQADSAWGGKASGEQ